MTAEIVQPTKDAIARAADILRSGGLVAMPTETVYGLACDAANSEAVARLYAAKERPSFNPLIAHVLDVEQATREGVFSDTAEGLADSKWPGPLTLVTPLAQSQTVCDLARAGLETVALRSPAHAVARALLETFGGPVVAPSANPSGMVSPTRPEHVLDDMAEAVDLILDGGSCE
ncbi:MAG: L-threonylcarbamoyladenylate synthase, partial [Pseudomonadota bacterium]